MRFVFGLVLILGLALAGSAVYLVQGYLNQSSVELEQARAALENQVATTEIYVAAVPLPYGHVLTPEDVRKVKFPTESLPEGTFQDEAQLFPDGNASPRKMMRSVEANEPLLAVKVTEPGEEPGISTMLASGMRAFTISVDAQSGVGGFIRPESRVDIFWIGETGGREQTIQIDTNVRVIAVDQSFDPDKPVDRVPQTITVEGTPQQAANLRAAGSAGRLSLALVGEGDTTGGQATNVDLNTVLGITEAPPPPEVEEAAPEEKCYVTQRVPGAEPIQIEVDCNN